MNTIKHLVHGAYFDNDQILAVTRNRDAQRELPTTQVEMNETPKDALERLFHRSFGRIPVNPESSELPLYAVHEGEVTLHSLFVVKHFERQDYPFSYHQKHAIRYVSSARTLDLRDTTDYSEFDFVPFQDPQHVELSVETGLFEVLTKIVHGEIRL